MAQRLSTTQFAAVIRNTPLISIDLIVRNKANQVLLGQRLNRPAQGYWFVPGGRIFKNERLADAFARLTREELGSEMKIEQANLLGVFEHLYEDCVFGDQTTTHYVVTGMELQLEHDLDDLPCAQHDHYRWFDQTLLLSADDVHTNTKAYFVPSEGIRVSR
ncbi:GDP-mannose mannosyl hydrolase [Pokkaliibacter plantistimulans]|uniref:GDP-mannose mannosyl hydrolase n=1 Tax=Proteobacteria bacterium 228 TaxID=2083153 RepID=A0A2S5KKB7_9PROT|nr:GDP-mannose mannosyl hydrolase [Pokkaliibacter plantistimulans]PPC74959.1 GDP-mannose mannosyl hydrolase [Pokkaliibacter plantistimulans]